jgi:hypothetical protein
MTPYEIDCCKYWGVIPERGPGSRVPCTSCIRVIEDKEAESHDGPVSDPFGRAWKFMQGAVEEAQPAVWALRLFQSGRFCAAHIIVYRSDADFAVGGHWYISLPQLMPTGYLLGPKEADEFKAFWEASRQGLGLKGLRFALLRYSDAGTRERSDDKLIDLMIAAEAMFLPDLADELKYRLALRVAAFLETEAGARMKAFREVKDAYDLRSQVIHGIGLKGDLPDTANGFEERMRRALRKAVASGGKTWPPAWEDLTLGSGALVPHRTES